MEESENEKTNDNYEVKESISNEIDESPKGLKQAEQIKKENEEKMKDLEIKEKNLNENKIGNELIFNEDKDKEKENITNENDNKNTNKEKINLKNDNFLALA